MQQSSVIKPIYFYISAGVVLLITLFFALTWRIPLFDYDFERFFPLEDEELVFYQKYRETFGNDNDYLLLAIHRAQGVFEKDFLDQVKSVETSLQSITSVEQTVSLLSLKEPRKAPMGVIPVAVLRADSEDLSRDSARIMQQERLVGNLIDESASYLNILIKHEDRISKEDGDQLYAAIKEMLAEQEISDYVLAGKAKAQGVFVSKLQSEFALFLSISAVLILLMLAVTYRTWWAVLLPFVLLLLAIFWTISWMSLAGKALDVLSVMLPTILLIVGMSAIIHLMNKYLFELRAGRDKLSAISRMIKEVGWATFLTCLTTAIGFGVLWFSDVAIIRDFGVFTGIGVLLSFGIIIMVLPLILWLMPIPQLSTSQQTDSRWRQMMQSLMIIVLRKKKAIMFITSLLIVLSVWSASRIDIDGYIIDDLPEGDDLVEDFTFFDERFGGSKPVEFYLEEGESAKGLYDLPVLKEMAKLEKYILSEYGAAHLNSPLQAIKLANKYINREESLPDSQAEINQLLDLIKGNREIRSLKLTASDDQIGRISGRMPDIGSKLGGEKYADLKQFIQEEINPDLLQVRLTGTSHLIDISHNQLSFSVFEGLGYAFLVIGVLMGLLFRSIKFALISLVPNIIPLLLTAMVMGIFNIDLKLSTSIIFTIAFGIAVDDTIHFMAKVKQERGRKKSMIWVLRSVFISTGKSMVLTTLMLGLGFGVLIFSQFGVTFYTGVLVTGALIFALLADLFVLPLLLISSKRES